MNKRDLMVQEGRTWLGVRWMHNCRDKEIGVDCINFLWAIATEAGLNIPPIPRKYHRVAFNDGITKYLEANFARSQTGKVKKGSILLFKFAGYNNHVGIATSSHSVIHACRRRERVVEHELDGIWQRILSGIWEVD